MIGSARAGTTAERHRCGPESCALEVRALASAPGELCFPLDMDWVENHVLMLGFREVRLGNQEF